ncbi:uncharacterized protein LOC126319991 [Schistocerca gregaria]|uniref:uncharacterized protein LOC126319991 n=1 Tax=Schistocerca gregaria TaxID=7010 RepID=UPI00211F120E|nr:uncharacterized protein LOC126319991 [Schistocerca gregaria]
MDPVHPTCSPQTDRNKPFTAPLWAAVPPSSIQCYIVTLMNQNPIQCVKLENSSTWIIGQPKPFNPTFPSDHKSVSRQNTAICFHKYSQQFYLIDLQSAYGTFLNDTKVSSYVPVPLVENSRIQCGQDTSRTFSFCSGLPPAHIESLLLTSPQESIRASHILVKHAQSRRPASWRQAQITRSKQDAYSIIKEYLRLLQNEEADFATLASKFSDCSSAPRGGDLGFIKQKTMHEQFERAAFKLKIGELSDIVETNSGLHIIKRTA